MTLKNHYTKNVLPKMKQQYSYKNDLAVPRIKKAVVNVGLGKGLNDKNFQEAVIESLKRITGQMPITTIAKKSIAGFGIREDSVVGAKVTLRGNAMYTFVDKIINVVLPRVRDFRGLNEKIIDEQGNLNLGFKENSIFPEINPEDNNIVHGLEVAIVTSAKSRAEAVTLFNLLKFPFKHSDQKK